MNKQRRQLLKTASALTAASVALAASPSMVTAACSPAEHASSRLAGLPGGLRIELSRVGTQAYVTMINTLNTPVTLTHVYPGVVSDNIGSVDINSLLTTGPKTVMPGEPWISKIDGEFVASRSAPTSPTKKQGVKITVATHNPTPDGYKLVETTRTLLVG